MVSARIENNIRIFALTNEHPGGVKNATFPENEGDGITTWINYLGQYNSGGHTDYGAQRYLTSDTGDVWEWVNIPRRSIVDSITTGGVPEESISIENIIGQVVDICEFELFDPGYGSNNLKLIGNPDRSNDVIRIMQDIRIVKLDRLYQSSVSLNRIDILFGGLVAYISGNTEGAFRRWHISCQDYTLLLDRTMVLQDYPPDFKYPDLLTGPYTGDVAILKAAFEKDSLGIDGESTSSEISVELTTEGGFVRKTEALDNIGQHLFKFSTLREVVAQLAQYVGNEFYVDYQKRLHYFYREDSNSDFILTDNPEHLGQGGRYINYRDINWKKDGTRLVNTIALFGERLLSDSQIALLLVNGNRELNLSQDSINTNLVLLPPPGRESISVSSVAGLLGFYDASSRPGYRQFVLVQGNPVGHVTQLSVSLGTGFRVTRVESILNIGSILINVTDGSWGVVQNVEDNVVTCPLRQGRRNYWSFGDWAVSPFYFGHPVHTTNPARMAPDGAIEHNPNEKILKFPIAPTSFPHPNTPDFANRYELTDTSRISSSLPQYGPRIEYAVNFTDHQISTDITSFDTYGRTFARRVSTLR